MKFSERIGKTPVPKLVERKTISHELSNRLWNIIENDVLLKTLFDDSSSLGSSISWNYCASECKNSIQHKNIIWDSFFKERISTVPNNRKSIMHEIQTRYDDYKWYEKFDFIEFFLTKFEIENLPAIVNTALQEEKSAYRIINNQVTEISDEMEQKTIDIALEHSDKFSHSKHHLKLALSHYANRDTSDYSNSIKESIHAVESTAKVIVGNDNDGFGKLMAKLKTEYEIPESLKLAFTNLYGYASNESGIRHAMNKNDTPATAKDAKFMLVTCSAFINYIIETCET